MIFQLAWLGKTIVNIAFGWFSHISLPNQGVRSLLQISHTPKTYAKIAFYNSGSVRLMNIKSFGHIRCHDKQKILRVWSKNPSGFWDMGDGRFMILGAWLYIKLIGPHWARLSMVQFTSICLTADQKVCPARRKHKEKRAWSYDHLRIHRIA